MSGGGYQNAFTGDDTASSASVSVAGVAGTSFTMSTQFTVNTVNPPTGSVSTIGFGALGGDAVFSASSLANAYYLADFGYAYAMNAAGGDKGRLRILALGDTQIGYSATNTGGNFNGNTTNLAIQTGVTYTLRLTGTYSGGSLSMSLGLFDAAGTTQIGTSATATDATPLTGSNFGIRNRNSSNSSGTSSLNATFDNFSVTNIPEPSTALLGTLGALALLRRRR